MDGNRINESNIFQVWHRSNLTPEGWKSSGRQEEIKGKVTDSVYGAEANNLEGMEKAHNL